VSLSRFPRPAMGFANRWHVTVSSALQHAPYHTHSPALARASRSASPVPAALDASSHTLTHPVPLVRLYHHSCQSHPAAQRCNSTCMPERCMMMRVRARAAAASARTRRGSQVLHESPSLKLIAHRFREALHASRMRPFSLAPVTSERRASLVRDAKLPSDPAPHVLHALFLIEHCAESSSAS
jgi:hypothetical protein